MEQWPLIHEIVGSLGDGWEVSASGLQELGHMAGLLSGPNGMRPAFIARTEKLDPSMEQSCPPLGWLRVDARLSFDDQDISSALSILLQESLTPTEIANELLVRFLPLYTGFLAVVQRHDVQVKRQS